MAIIRDKPFHSFILLFLPSLTLLSSGCAFIPRDSIELDTAIAAKKDQYVWTVPGHRRVTMLYVPLYFTFERDDFWSVSSDGHNFVAATACQRRFDSDYVGRYMYIIDGKSGKLLSVTPIKLSVPNIWLTDKCAILEGTLSLRDPQSPDPEVVEVRRVPDGKLLLEWRTAGINHEWLTSIAVAGPLLRLHHSYRTQHDQSSCREAECIEEDLFWDMPTAKRLSETEANTQIATLISQGNLDRNEPWTTFDMYGSHLNDVARCGNLIIRIVGDRWLVAEVDDSTSTEP